MPKHFCAKSVAYLTRSTTSRLTEDYKSSTKFSCKKTNLLDYYANKTLVHHITAITHSNQASCNNILANNLKILARDETHNRFFFSTGHIVSADKRLCNVIHLFLNIFFINKTQTSKLTTATKLATKI